MNTENKRDYNYIKVFLFAFLIFALSVAPSLIAGKGIWVFYGDFNVQQIPFYMHCHEAIRSGRLFYDWGTDLGGSLLGMYSFYLLGSPFFWLTLPFPTEAIPYLMPWISALKYAVMALTAYAYMKRRTKKAEFAMIGALLYTFSGYQGAVLVYNHFHDVLAFFPLYLMSFERLFSDDYAIRKKETSDNNPKYFGFIFMTAFMVVLNYYFFVGQAVFLVIYYFARYGFDKERALKKKIFDLIRALACGLSGVLLSGVYIFPAIQYTLGNSRLSSTLMGYDLVAYSEPTMILGIIKNTVMLTDVSGLNSMLNANYSRVSGVGAYLPLFSIAGVVAYFLYNKEKRNWQKRLLIICAVFAAFPVLNSLFSALNSEYYARWFFMPVFFMALMTAEILEEREEAVDSLKVGVKTVTVITVAISLMSVLPAKTAEGELTVLGALRNYEQLISEIIFSFVMLFLLYIYVHILSKKKDMVTQWVVRGACLLTTLAMLLTGTFLVDMDRRTDYISQALKGTSPLEASLDEGFYRFETDEDFYNYPLVWDDSHCITSFISTISDSTLSFYDAFDLPRKVTSNLWTSRIGMRAILSSKYFLTNNMHSIEFIGHVEDMSDLKDYTLVGEKEGFNIYENENYIPMGFAFDSYITQSELETCEYSTSAKDRLLACTLILPDEMEKTAEKILEHASPESFQTISLGAFERACDARREMACTDFKTSTYGFSAKSNLELGNYIFFSVPYEKGFKAYVDGEETQIIRADYGFMCIPVPAGEHDIEFKFSLYGSKEGMYLSFAGLSIAFILLIVTVYKKEKEKSLLKEE